MQETWYNARNGQRVMRKSSDRVWPLRAATGETWAEVSSSRVQLVALVEACHYEGAHLVNPLGPLPAQMSSVDTLRRLRKGVLS
jgi:hypothetical protein